MSLARKPAYAQRRVVTAPYFFDLHGRLRPKRPKGCSRLDCASVCRIAFHRWRTRKYGVEHPLACFICREHDCSFTVYPPGWLPFGRRPVVCVTASGFDIGGLEDSVEAWADTAFGAAVDAGAKRLWPVTAGGCKEWEERYGREAYGVRRTQARHVAGVLMFMALSAELALERPKVAAVLDFDLSTIAVCAARPRDGPPLVACGAKGAELLSAVGRPCRRLLPGFVRLGADRQYWGPPINTH
jgi:hypothetical protein